MEGTETTGGDTPTRRSQRKTKKIDKDRLMERLATGRRVRVTPQRTALIEIPADTERNCRKLMQADQRVHWRRLIWQMGQALSSQQKRLQEMFQIKLQMDTQSQPPPKPPATKPSPVQVIKEEPDEQEEWSASIEDHFQPHNPLQEPHSQPEQLMGEEDSEEASGDQVMALPRPSVRLVRRDSARLLCDNYENNDLVYSVQTLIPRMARQDVDHHFIGI